MYGILYSPLFSAKGEGHMDELREVLSKASEISNRDIAVIWDKGCCRISEQGIPGLSYEEARQNSGSSWKGYIIYPFEAVGKTYYVCIRAEGCRSEAEDQLILLAIKSAVFNRCSEDERLAAALKEDFDTAVGMRLEEAYGQRLCGYVLLVSGYEDCLNEVLQIMDNTIETTLRFEYEGRILAVSPEGNIEEACESLSKNILSELLLECTVAIGGRSGGIQDLRRMLDCCLEALFIRRTYGLSDTVMNYDKLYAYRAVSCLSPGTKADILAKVFTREFKEMLNSELSITIEELFKNNLNLTDAAGKLYIHRNTLLYRLDKIFKCTGFDLKKFEDSWLFRLAWLINKEK